MHDGVSTFEQRLQIGGGEVGSEECLIPRQLDRFDEVDGNHAIHVGGSSQPGGDSPAERACRAGEHDVGTGLHPPTMPW